MGFQRFVISTISVLLTLNAGRSMAQVKEQEYALKAAFVYRFIDYVDWGNNTADETFTIGVAGESELVPLLQEISKNKKAKNRRIVIRQVESAAEVASCQLLFISRAYKLPVGPMLEAAERRPLLVISESEEDFDRGTHLNFLVAGNRLRFEVNLKTVSLSGLKISSQLLQHALTIRR